MATAGTRKKAKTTKTPQTAEEKAARASLFQADQLALEQRTAAVKTQSRGAYKPRRLRSGGTDLLKYESGNFTSDAFPKIGGYTNTQPPKAVKPPKAKPKPQPKPRHTTKPRTTIKSKDQQNKDREAANRQRKRDVNNSKKRPPKKTTNRGNRGTNPTGGTRGEL